MASELAKGTWQPTLAERELSLDEMWAMPSGGRLKNPADLSLVGFVEDALL